MKKKGLLVAVEGIDGVGKTTVSKKLTSLLKEIGFKTYYTFEPSDGFYGKIVRRLISRGGYSWKWEIALLLALDRAWHVKEIILPLLNDGYIIVCDRYLHSQLAYQVAEGLDRYVIEKLNSEFPKPDLVLFLDADPGRTLLRLNAFIKKYSKSDKRSIYNDEAFLRRVRQIYFEYINDKRFTRKFHVVDMDSVLGCNVLLSEREFKLRIERLARKLIDIIMNLAET